MSPSPAPRKSSSLTTGTTPSSTPWWVGADVKRGDAKIHVSTLLDALNDFVQRPERKTEAPMRLPLSGIYKIKGVGDVLAGRVEQGQVKPNEDVVFLPTHNSLEPLHRQGLLGGDAPQARGACDSWRQRGDEHQGAR